MEELVAQYLDGSIDADDEDTLRLLAASTIERVFSAVVRTDLLPKRQITVHVVVLASRARRRLLD